MSLEKRLEMIADTKTHSYQCAAHSESQECCIEKPEIVAQIKQAFADEGYVSPENAAKVQSMVNQMAQLAQDNFHMPTMVNVALDKKQQTMQKLMTGQEWYDRLFIQVQNFNYDNRGSVNIDWDEYLDSVAKRAANIQT